MKCTNLALACLLASVSALVACGKSEPKKEAPPPVARAAAEGASGASPVGATEAGIAIYPGAETLMSGHQVGVGGMTDSAFKSADKPEKVAAFYREELGRVMGDKSKVGESAAGEGIVHLQAGDGVTRIFDVMIRPEGSDTIFSIKAMVKAK